MRHHQWLAAVFLAAAAGGTRPVAAQEALVLSGGGARGLAHAGVVVGLDSLGIDPNIVTGTSMGAIIGALYAAGIEPGRIRSMIEQRNWMHMFAPEAVFVGPDAAALRPLLRWPIGTGWPGLQQGLVPDRSINRELVRLLFDAQVRVRGDFDRLPRRYRAVTTDLRTGQEVVVGRGDLSRVVRASMAVPGVFTPEDLRGRWLVDGGISDNLPIAPARALGADTVIAVDVVRPSPHLKGLDFIDMGGRAVRMLIMNTAADSLRPDFLILPPIPASMSGASFPRNAAPLIRLGLDATLATLGPLATSHRRRARPHPLPPPPPGFSGLDVHAPEPGIADLVRRAFAPATRGPYDPAAVVEAVDAVYASGLVDGVWPHVDPDAPGDPDAPDGPGRPRLRVDVLSPAATALLGAAAYDTDRGGRAWGGIRHRFATAAPLELMAAGSVQDLAQWGSISAHAVLPALPQLAVDAGGYGRNTEVRIFDDGDITGELGVIRVGARAGVNYYRVAPDLRALVEGRAEWIREQDGREGFAWGPRVLLAVPSPRIDPVGVPPLLDAEFRVGDFRYALARGRGSVNGRLGPLLVAALADVTWVGDFPIGPAESVTGAEALGSPGAAGGEAPLDVWPFLGGDDGVPGLRWGEGLSPAVAVTGIDIAAPILIGGFVRLQLRAGAAGERPADWGESEAWVGGARIGVFWSTPFGPLSGGVGYATSGDWRAEVAIGPQF